MIEAHIFLRALRESIRSESCVQYEFADCSEAQAMEEILPQLLVEVVGSSTQEIWQYASKRIAECNEILPTLDPEWDWADEPETSASRWRGIRRAWQIVVDAITGDDSDLEED